MQEKCGSSSVGRAWASQAQGRGFEPRLPLIQTKSTHHYYFFQKKYSSLKREMMDGFCKIRFFEGFFPVNSR